MNFGLINSSSDPRITPVYLAELADALEQALINHWGPLWQAVGPACLAGPVLLEGYSPITLYDTLPDDPNAIADHEVSATQAGLPIGRVSVTAALQEDPDIFGGIPVAISHEAFEAAADPYANQLAIEEDGTLWMLECADPVEGSSYKVGRVSISNFVGPRFFREGPGPYDQMGLVSSPWTIQPNGYAVKGPDIASLTPIFGEKVSEAAKARVLARHRMRRLLAA